MALSLLNDLFRSIRVAVLLFRTALGEMPVLTIFASEITTGTGDAQPEMAGKEMIERCLFYRTNINHRGFSINDCI